MTSPSAPERGIGASVDGDGASPGGDGAADGAPATRHCRDSDDLLTTRVGRPLAAPPAPAPATAAADTTFTGSTFSPGGDQPGSLVEEMQSRHGADGSVAAEVPPGGDPVDEDSFEIPLPNGRPRPVQPEPIAAAPGVELGDVAVQRWPQEQGAHDLAPAPAASPDHVMSAPGPDVAVASPELDREAEVDLPANAGGEGEPGSPTAATEPVSLATDVLTSAPSPLASTAQEAGTATGLAEPAAAAVDVPAVPPSGPPAPPLAAEPPPAVPPPDDEEEEDGKSMTIIEHLEELRQRLTLSSISIVVGAVIGWFVVPRLVQYLEASARRDGVQFFNPSILGPFGLEIKLAFMIGLVLASPMVFYQIWAFVAPGLTRRERRYALPFSLIGSLLFAAGAVAGVMVIPLAIHFLTGFFPVLGLEKLLDIGAYIGFITMISMIFGITFELPIFMVGFSLLGVVNSRFFVRKFRVAVFIIYGVSMVITPGADFISPLILGTFLVVLYWFGVALIRFIGR